MSKPHYVPRPSSEAPMFGDLPRCKWQYVANGGRSFHYVVWLTGDTRHPPDYVLTPGRDERGVSRFNVWRLVTRCLESGLLEVH